MKTTAAVLVELGKPLQLVELELPPLKPGQVLVELRYSGVCHTQLLEARGHRGADPYVPHCLGHEGSGVVVAISEGVSKVSEGDEVICTWLKGSGANVPGTVYDWDGQKVNAGAITTFGTRMVMSENRLHKLPEGVSLRDAAALGCAVPTGLGVVFNTARPQPGQSLAVFGSGGIGLCAVAGASIAGCSPIIAIDLLPSKLEAAKRFGATHTLLASECDPVAELGKLCPGGVDFAIEATGRPDVMLQAMAAVRSQGGVAVVAGNAHAGEHMALDPKQLNQGKQLRGTWGGDSQPDRDFPRFGRLLRSGRLNVEPLFDKVYGLDEINAALDDLEAGRTVRPLIEFPTA